MRVNTLKLLMYVFSFFFSVVLLFSVFYLVTNVIIISFVNIGGIYRELVLILSLLLSFFLSFLIYHFVINIFCRNEQILESLKKPLFLKK